MITVQFFDFDVFDKLQVHVCNINFLKRRIGWNQASAPLQIAKEYFEIVVISGDCEIRMAAHRGVVFQKLHDDIGNVVDLIQIHREDLLVK